MVMRPGSWWLRSKTDPRWDSDGTSPLVGGFVMPSELRAELDRKKLELGEQPADLEFGYMKD